MAKHNGLQMMLLGATLVAFTLGLTSAVGVPAVVAAPYDDLQAPRAIHLDSEARNNDPLQAPRQQDMQPPRG